MLKNIQGKTIGNIWKTLFYPKKYFKKKSNNAEKLNKTGTSKVGAISEAQKAQKKFWKKIEIFEKFFSFKKSRIVPKNVKGGSFWIYKHTFRCKISKNSKGGPFGDKKKFRKKSRTVPKKLKGGPYSLVLFCILR